MNLVAAVVHWEAKVKQLPAAVLICKTNANEVRHEMGDLNAEIMENIVEKRVGMSLPL